LKQTKELCLKDFSGFEGSIETINNQLELMFSSFFVG